MRIFIAGPMRGRPQYNFPAFYEAERLIRGFGHEVVNPAALDEREGFDPDAEHEADDLAVLVKGFAARNVVAMAECDAIALLPDWDESEGAKLDLAFAQYLGLDVLWANSGMRADVRVILTAG